MDTYGREIFSNEIHAFLKEIRKKNISMLDKEKIYFIVNNLAKRTKNQKRRFLLYYGILLNEKPLKFAEIAKIDKCSNNAIRCSIISVRNNISQLTGRQLDILWKIIRKYKGEDV